MSGNGHLVPDDTPPSGHEWLLQFFWAARSFCDKPEVPLRLSDIYEYRDHSGALLDRNDIDILTQMDRAFREQYPKTIAAHEALRQRNQNGRS